MRGWKACPPASLRRLEQALCPVHQLLYTRRPSRRHAKLHQHQAEQHKGAVEAHEDANVAGGGAGVKPERLQVRVADDTCQFTVPARLQRRLLVEGSEEGARGCLDRVPPPAGAPEASSATPKACPHLSPSPRTWNEKVLPVISLVIMASKA